MNQLDLFKIEPAKTERKTADAVAIRSGIVGPIRFGSTEASYSITRDVLTDLVAPLADAEPASA
jgi:hypothetical protein